MTDSSPALSPASPGSPTQPKTPAISVWSLALGILSVFCIWILGSIPAIILGIMGMNKANADPQNVGGKGLALAGIITGSLGIMTGIATMGMYAGILFPALAGVKSKTEEALVVNNMRKTILALDSYAVHHNARYPTTLDELIPDYLASEEFFLQTHTESEESTHFLYLAPETREGNLSEIKLLMSPFPISGRRVAGYADGRIEVIEDPLPKFE